MDWLQEIWDWVVWNPVVASAVFAGLAVVLTILAHIFGAFGWLWSRRAPDNVVQEQTQTGQTGGLGVQARDIAGAVQQVTGLDPTALADQLVQAGRQIGQLERELQQSHEERRNLSAAVEALEARAAAGEEPDRIAEALQMLETNDTSAAEAIFRDVLEEEENKAKGAAANPKAADAARHLGALAFLHDTKAAVLAYKEALALEPEDADSWNELGKLRLRLGQVDLAEQAFQRVLELGQQGANKSLIAKATGNIGLVYSARGDLSRAEEAHRKALALSKEQGSKEGMAIQYGNLGVIHDRRGDLDNAEQAHRQALALNEELGSKEGMAADYGNLGLIHEMRGDLDGAEQAYRRALAFDEEVGSKEGMAIQYGNLGLIHQMRGDLDNAEQAFRQALAFNQELGRRQGMAIQNGNLGSLAWRRGDRTSACDLWSKAKALFDQVGMSDKVAQTEALMKEAGCDQE